MQNQKRDERPRIEIRPQEKCPREARKDRNHDCDAYAGIEPTLASPVDDYGFDSGACAPPNNGFIRGTSEYCRCLQEL